MNKPVYLGLSKLEISETLMYEFWHDYIKQKYQQNAKLCYTLYYAISIRRKDYDRVCSAQTKNVFLLTVQMVIVDTRAKRTKNCVIKQMLKFNDYKNFLLNNEIILKLH